MSIACGTRPAIIARTAATARSWPRVRSCRTDAADGRPMAGPRRRQPSPVRRRGGHGRAAHRVTTSRSGRTGPQVRPDRPSCGSSDASARRRPRAGVAARPTPSAAAGSGRGLGLLAGRPALRRGAAAASPVPSAGAADGRRRRARSAVGLLARRRPALRRGRRRVGRRLGGGSGIGSRRRPRPSRSAGVVRRVDAPAPASAPPRPGGRRLGHRLDVAGRIDASSRAASGGSGGGPSATGASWARSISSSSGGTSLHGSPPERGAGRSTRSARSAARVAGILAGVAALARAAGGVPAAALSAALDLALASARRPGTG